MTLLEQNVLGLDVPVQHTHAVRVSQRVRDGLGNGEGLFLGQRAARRPFQLLAQRAAFDVRHDVIQEAAGLARVVQRENVRMAQPRSDLDFLEKALGAEVGSQAGKEHFQRD